MSADAGSLCIAPLAWDTRFFGFAIAALALDDAAPLPALHDAVGRARAAGFQLVVVSDAPDASGAALATLGARRVDTKVDYAAPVHAAFLPRGIEILAAAPDPADRAALDALALASGAHSRFRTDPRFGTERWEQLYRQWLANSLSGEIADAVLVQREQGAITGFATVKDDGDGTARIGLLAVAAERRGRGIGAALLGAVHSLASQRGLTHVRVATQADNPGACRLYARAGFEPASRVGIHHLWLDGNGEAPGG